MRLITHIQSKLLVSLIATCALCITSSVAAHGIEDFDRGSGVWKASPTKISRTTLPGWEVATNDNENAFVNNPTTTRYTYYWKLTRTETST